MRLHKTWSVSFPRSGHHLLVQMLAKYFGDELKYCERYVETSLVDHPETNLVKSHDFECQDVYDPKWKYIVQVRDPVESIQSWYDFEKPDRRMGSFDEFFSKRLEDWIRFFNKWVINRDFPAIAIHYRQLTAEPIKTLARVVKHISDGPLDAERLIEASKGVVDVPGLRSCRYFGGEVWSGNKLVIMNDGLIERIIPKEEERKYPLELCPEDAWEKPI